MGFYNLVWYFLIYAFGGWCLEVAYKAVTVGKFVNRGFLNGPVCPIYGVGMVIIIYALTPISQNKLFMFVGAVVVCSALEWLVGFCLEKLFHAKWWDYSNVPFNLNGYICLKFSLYWGIAGVFVMDVIQPTTMWFVGKIPYLLGCIMAVLFVVALMIDVALTVNVILKLNRDMRRLSEIGVRMRNISDSLGQEIFEGVVDFRERVEAAKERMEEVKEEAEQRAEEFVEEVLQQIALQVGESPAENVFLNPRDKEIQKSVELVARQGEEELKALREEYEAGFRNISKSRTFFGKRLMKAFPDLKHEMAREEFESLRSRWGRK